MLTALSIGVAAHVGGQLLIKNMHVTDVAHMHVTWIRNPG